MKSHKITGRDFLKESGSQSSSIQLKNGSRVGVVGGGPAGSFFSYFLLGLSDRVDLKLDIDIYEPKDFSKSGPQGCNKCGGIISETLVQHLAAEGINLPASIVQRGIDSYVMHTDVGSARIETPLHEKRIGAVYRGCGPRGTEIGRWDSFDGYLLNKAIEKGAHIIKSRVDSITFIDDFPQLVYNHPEASKQTYDLVVIANGINTSSLPNLDKIISGYRAPGHSKTYIKEYHLGSEIIEQYLGSSMHVFLLKLPRLEFAAIIPKGDFVTVCILGENIDKDLVSHFMQSPEVKSCFPPNFELDGGSCQCWPSINTRGSQRPFCDRVVFIGDSSYSRLYKDGIGAAFITAKAAANTAILQGIATEDFKRSYWPVCKRIDSDNQFGKILFLITKLFQNLRFTRRAILKTIITEQRKPQGRKIMSTVLWDLFSGSSSYREIFLNTLRLSFMGRFAWNSAVSLINISKEGNKGE